MFILVDSLVRIDYFRTGNKSDRLDEFIDNNLICTNNVILAELVSFLRIKKAHRVIHLLNEITRIPLKIDWEAIIDYQTLFIEKGINNIGIPDLIILQNVLQNELILYSFDKHFKLMNQYFQFELFGD